MSFSTSPCSSNQPIQSLPRSPATHTCIKAVFTIILTNLIRAVNSLDYDVGISSSSVWNKNPNNLVSWIYNEPWVGSVGENSPSFTSPYFAIWFCSTTIVNPVESKLLIPMVDYPHSDFRWSRNRFKSRTIGNCNCNCDMGYTKRSIVHPGALPCWALVFWWCHDACWTLAILCCIPGGPGGPVKCMQVYASI